MLEHRPSWSLRCLPQAEEAPLAACWPLLLELDPPHPCVAVYSVPRLDGIVETGSVEEHSYSKPSPISFDLCKHERLIKGNQPLSTEISGAQSLEAEWLVPKGSSTSKRLENTVVDLLVKALKQTRAASKVASQESVALSCQATDNTLGALAILNNTRTKNHRRKFLLFGKLYVDSGKFPKSKAEAVGRVLSYWKPARYESTGAPAITDKQVPEARAVADNLLNFAIDEIASASGTSPAELYTIVASTAREVYGQDVYPWKAEQVPGEAEFKALDFLDRIKERCTAKGLFFEEDVGAISGLTRIACLGLPPPNTLTEFEEEIYWMIALKLQECLNDFNGLRNQVQFRLATGKEARDHDLRWALLFNLLIKSLSVAIEDDVDISHLLLLAKKWADIILRVRVACGVSKLEAQKGKLLAKNVGARFATVESKLQEWLTSHPDFAKLAEPELLLHEIDVKRSFFGREMPSEYDLALIAVPSPRAMTEFAGRLENLIRDFWSDGEGNAFPRERIRLALEMEEHGRDPYEEQRNQGIGLGDFCLGLEDLAKWLARFHFTKADEGRIHRWEWLEERIGKENIASLFQMIEKERRRLREDNSKRVREPTRE